MGDLLSELGRAVRFAARHPGFALAAVLTLGLGIGASSTVFALLHALTIRPLGYADAAGVLLLQGWDEARDESGFGIPLAAFVALQSDTDAFSDLAAYRYWSAGLSGDGVPERVQAYRVTGGTFPLLGRDALLGRVLEPADARPSAPRVAVISHGLWQRRFGRGADVVGSPVRLDGEAFTVVGVMPADFEFPVFNFKGDIWVPLAVDAAAALAEPGRSGSVVAIGRLAPETAPSTAEAQARTAFARRAEESPATFRGLAVRLLPLQELGAREARPALLALLGAVVGVLVLGCVNLASLQLARGIGRRRELAVRAALGASRARLVRQLTIESVVLAGAGVGLGLLFAHWALLALRGALPAAVLTTMPNVAHLRVEAPVVAFSAALGALTVLAFGLPPAWRAGRSAGAPQLSSGARSLGSGEAQRLRGALVLGQVSLSLALLVVAGLALQSFRGLLQRGTGFVPSGVLTFTVALPEGRYPDDAQRLAFFERAQERLAALPGVDGAAGVNVLPFSTYDRGTTVLADGAPEPEPGTAPRAAYRVATPGYFETLEIPLEEGRDFDAHDRADGSPVAILNQKLARREFGDADPVGRRIRVGGPSQPWRVIVGVVGNVRHSSLAEDPRAEVYLPLAQAPESMMMLTVKTSVDPLTLVAPARAAILALDPDQPVFHVSALDRKVAEALLLPGMEAALFGAFGGAALLLSALGLYGLLSFVVGQRTSELGLRMALGATPASVVRQVVGGSVRLLVPGLALGVVLAAMLGRVLRGLFFQVDPLDPIVYASMAGLLAVTALLAAAAPAARAARIDPARALREE